MADHASTRSAATGPATGEELFVTALSAVLETVLTLTAGHTGSAEHHYYIT